MSPSLPKLTDVDRRMALAFGAVVFVLMLIVLLAGGSYLHGLMNREQDKLSSLTTRVLANAVSRISFSGKYHARLMLEEVKQANPDIAYLRLVDPSGQVIADSDVTRNDTRVDATQRALIDAVVSQRTPEVVREFEQDGVPLREVTLIYRGGHDNAVQGVMQVGLSEADSQRALRKGMAYVAALTSLLLLAGIVLTWRLSAHFGKPIRQVAHDLAQERALNRTGFRGGRLA